MKKILIVALFFAALISHGTDTDIVLPLIDPSYETVILSEEKFEHLLLAFRRSYLVDECLTKMQQAARPDLRKFSLFIDDPATYICLPLAFSFVFSASGFMLGDINRLTETSAIVARSFCAICLWVVGILLYVNIPIKHKGDLQMEDQNQIYLDALIKRLNGVVIKDIQVIKIARVIEGFEIKIHSSIINSLEKLDIFPLIIKTRAQ